MGSLDRISRNSILEAQSLFGLIIGAGITLVMLLDKREYSRESITASPTDLLIISIVIMMRGNEESTTKSRRVADAYEQKRKDAATGTATKPFNAPPAWRLERHYTSACRDPRESRSSPQHL